MRRYSLSRATLSTYPHWFYFPAGLVFGIFFIIPTAAAFYFSLTRWTLFDATFIAFKNYETFFKSPQLNGGLINTIIYAVLTSGFKVVISLPLAMLLTSQLYMKGIMRSFIFFPVLVSPIAVGITFSVLMEPSIGLFNTVLGFFGLPQPDWLGNPSLALYSVAMVDIWRGLGIASVIFVAGIQSIPIEYFEAAMLEGGSWVKFRYVIIPMSRNALFTVILLSFIGGLRSFDLIWAMTNGGPGFASDVLTSVIYKQYQAGFYGISTAGNVVLFFLVTCLVYPMKTLFNRLELEL